MIIPRRRFLGSSLFLLGSNLLEALTTPLWRLGDRFQAKAAVATAPSLSCSVH